MKLLDFFLLAACLIVITNANPQQGGFLSNLLSQFSRLVPRLPQLGGRRPAQTQRPRPPRPQTIPQRPTLAPRPAGPPPRPAELPPRPFQTQPAPRPVQSRPVPVTQTFTNSQQNINSGIREIPAPSFSSSSSNSVSQPSSNTFSSSSFSSAPSSIPESNRSPSITSSFAQGTFNSPASSSSSSSSSFSSSPNRFPFSSSSSNFPSSSSSSSSSSSFQSFPIPPAPASSSFSSNDFPSSPASASPSFTSSFTNSQQSPPSSALIPESNRSPSFTQGSFSSGFVAPSSSNSFNSVPFNSITPQQFNSAPSPPRFNNAPSNTIIFSPTANTSSDTGPSVINLFGDSLSSSPLSQSSIQLGTTRPAPPRVITTTTLPPPPQPSFTSSNGNFNHEFAGRQYHLSWRVGQSDMSWSSARVYCRRRGLNMISLDNPSLREHVLQLIANENTPFMWAGARIAGSKTSVFWENGRSEGIRRGQHPWSFAGLRGPQPDGSGSEDCLAILNNLYNDGVKFHDVGCHHRKPTICEA